MDTYSLLREFADSWALLLLTLTFLGVIAWAWRPGSRKMHDDAANMIFRNDTKPAVDSEGGASRPRDPQQKEA
jgi:cytochrome c oxidase cbb3-type subunit IV